ALVTRTTHSDILPIPKTQARPLFESACRDPDAKLDWIRPFSNSLRGNLDDFGALSPADNPRRSVFIDRCNRIATVCVSAGLRSANRYHGRRVRRLMRNPRAAFARRRRG